ELLGERAVLGRGVEGRTEDHRVLPVVVGLEVAEPATLGGSAGRVGLRVEPEHDRLTLEVGQSHRVAVVVAAREIGRDVAGFQHHVSFRRGRLVFGCPRTLMAGQHATVARMPQLNASSQGIPAGWYSKSTRLGPARKAMARKMKLAGSTGTVWPFTSACQ